MNNQESELFAPTDGERDAGYNIACTMCQLRFKSYDQLEAHNIHYCTPGENDEIIKKHFNDLERQLLNDGVMSPNSVRLIILMKGLVFLKMDWDAYKNF